MARGLTTRYAHMSSIAVQEGDRREGQHHRQGPARPVDRPGHIFISKCAAGGSAVDPRPFLRAGRAVAELL